MGKEYEVKGRLKMKEKGGKVKERSPGDVSKSSGRISESDGSDEYSSDSDTDECYEPLGMEAWRYPMYSPSASYRQVDVVSGSHQYTISGFPLARSMGCGTRLCSDFFEVCGQLFRLEIYPGGFTADASKYVSVFLTTPGSVNPSHIMYELAILDQTGKDRHIIEKRDSHSHHCQRQSQQGCSGWCHMHGPMMTQGRGIVAAVPKFIKAGFLIKHAHRYMPCDMLVLRATVRVLRGWSSAPTVHSHLGYNSGVSGHGGGSYNGAMPGSMTAIQMHQRQDFVPSNANPVYQTQFQAHPQPQPLLPAISGASCLCGGLPPHVHQISSPHAGQPGTVFLQPPPVPEAQAAMMLYAPVSSFQPSLLTGSSQQHQQQYQQQQQPQQLQRQQWSGPINQGSVQAVQIGQSGPGQPAILYSPQSQVADGNGSIQTPAGPAYLIYMSSPGASPQVA